MFMTRPLLMAHWLLYTFSFLLALVTYSSELNICVQCMEMHNNIVKIIISSWLTHINSWTISTYARLAFIYINKKKSLKPEQTVIPNGSFIYHVRMQVYMQSRPFNAYRTKSVLIVNVPKTYNTWKVLG